jgi:ubiquinone/menaquinone biosynthesis C-methylase UbiE
MKKEDLEREKNKYERAYKVPGYKMGQNRRSHALKWLRTLDKTSLLDIGCGRGELMSDARSLGFKKVMGVEVVSYLINNKDVIYGSITDIPFEDNEFDYVTCTDVMEHIPEEYTLDALNELKRVAAKGVIMVIANFPAHRGEDILHINIKPYKEWDRIIKEVFEGYNVKWLNKKGNISETWMALCDTNKT